MVHPRDAVMTGGPMGEKIAELLFEAGAIHISRKQPFILAAGWASPVYVDVRLLIGEACLRKIATDVAARYIEAKFPGGSFDAVVGAETAGIPFSAWLADRMGLGYRYVRKRPLGVGRNAQVEGGTVEGLRVLLMDDLTTDGGSKLAFARGLRTAGATVEHILTIFYQDIFFGAQGRLKEAGLILHPLATWADVLRLGRTRLMPAEDYEEVARFLADPMAWSARHGGRISDSARS